jgi:hypothetical protein
MLSTHWEALPDSRSTGATINPTGVLFISSRVSGNANGKINGARSGSARKRAIMMYEKIMAIRFLSGELLPVKAQRNMTTRKRLANKSMKNIPEEKRGGRVFR